MKFQFKIFLLLALCNSATARDVILLENMATQKEGEAVVVILQKKFNIPKRLISIKNKPSCNKTSEAIMHLCLTKEGALEIVKMNKHVVEETLGAFIESEEL